MNSKRFFLRILFLTLPALLLASCASVKPPTVVQLAIDVDAGVNPDSRGRASPLMVRYFELRSLAAFDGADFFSLFERDKETLGAELVAREEFQLQPKEQRKLERTLQPDTRYVGVVAAYRDLERATWRAAVAVTPEKVNPVTIRLDARKVTMTLR
jgi:type VI secretion system protein VasD